MPTTYKVTDFTDTELFSLLELSSNPTDNELEARIIQMLQRHMYLRTESGRQLFQFFKDIYEHFFVVVKEGENMPEYEADNTLEELENMNFDPTSEKAKQQQLINEKIADPTQTQRDLNTRRDDAIQASKANDTSTSTSNVINPDQLAFTKELQFAPGKINPLLKETYTRTISIDSQYRDQEYSVSTDFTVNFNETLKDVVKMKLYAVQIPVTWYTISNSYGSNFFYLKPREVKDGPLNTRAIYDNANHEYKIEIPPGNYDAAALVTAVNRGIQQAAIDYPDVSFGNTKLEYNSSAVKTTFTFDIQKLYDEFSYSVSYGQNTRALLGLRDISNVPITTICVDFPSTGINMNEMWPTNNATLTTAQRTLHLTQYKIVDNQEILLNNSITIELDGSSKTWANWIVSINATLRDHPLLYDSSLTDISGNGNRFFQWIIHPNRKKIPHVVGGKWKLTRLDGTDTYNGFVNLKKLLVERDTRLRATSTTTTITPSVAAEIPLNISGEKIVFRPVKDELGGVYISETDESNTISMEISNGLYTRTQLIAEINRIFATIPIVSKSSLTSTNDSDNNTTTTLIIDYTINKIYTSRDYRVVFYDINSFSRCTNASASYRNATIDTTLGYILGFHSAAEYEFNTTTLQRTTTENPFTINDTVIINNNTYNTLVTLTSDSVVNVYLYTYFMIILDDFNQNHLNDGLVTLSKRDYSVTLPSYANRKIAKQCNSTTNTLSDMNLTQKQVYSVEQILAEQNRQRDNYNQGVYVRDMFALLPVKTGTPGSIYVEFGGTLQQQERVYFGPVNIRRISVKLVNDKGDVVDLNGGNWSFQLVCEQLYQKGESA